MQEVSETIAVMGVLRSHKDQITCLKTSIEYPNLVLSGSRDKTICIWEIESQNNNTISGIVKKRLVGHHHIVEDIDLSIDTQYALSASWDGTLRLWHLDSGKTIKQFSGHKKDVLSAAFSPDNRQIVSGSRDKTVKLWNAIGICKWSSKEADNTSHKDWVTCVRFSPNVDLEPSVISAGWDKCIKVTELNEQKLKWNLLGHQAHINTVTISPDGSLCASGDKSGQAMLWDLNDEGKILSNLNCSSGINDLTFSPNRYWLCAATNEGNIIIWDLESKEIIAELILETENQMHQTETKRKPSCNCLCWSSDGTILYAGYSDSVIRIWKLMRSQNH